ncbi:MAG: CvpA family protein [Pseudomonadota bacterium]
MTSFDFFILSIIGLSVMFAWIRGLSREIVTLIAIGIGILAVSLFSGAVSGIFGANMIGPLIAVSLLFLITFIIASIALEIAVTKVWGRKPHRYDMIGGAVLGLVRGWLIVGLVFIFAYDEPTGAATNSPMHRAALKGVASSAAGFLEQLGVDKTPKSAAVADISYDEQ